MVVSGNYKDLTGTPMEGAGPLGCYSSTGTPQLRPRCPSASCAWPSFSSIGVCSKCVNISHAIKSQSYKVLVGHGLPEFISQFVLDDQNYTISWGYTGNGPGTYSNESAFFNNLSYKDQWAGIWYPMSSFLNFRYMTRHLAADKSRIELLEASECAIYACVKTYNVSVQNGISYQDIVSTWYNASKPEPDSGTLSYPIHLNPPHLEHNRIHSGPYTFSGYARDDIVSFIGSKFAGFISVSNALDVSWDQVGDPGWILAEGNVSQVVKNVALAFTDAIQTGQSNREEVFGQKSKSEIFVHIRWGYLAVPVTLGVCSALFLLLTMYKTRSSQTPLWKYENLVLLYHGLEDTPERSGHALNDLGEMRRRAKETKVRLMPGQTAQLRLVASTNET